MTPGPTIAELAAERDQLRLAVARLQRIAAAAIAETEAEEENLRHELLSDGVMAAVQARTRLAEARLARALAVREGGDG